MNKQEVIKKLGFSDEGFIYCIGGGNTYLIKDELKSQGCKFNPTYGWFSDIEIIVPAPYKLYKFSFDTLYEWSEKYKQAFPYGDTEKYIKAITSPKQESKYIGQLNERQYNLKVKYVKNNIIKNKNNYIFYFNNSKIIWQTQVQLTLSPNQEVLLTATVDSHKEYFNIKTTFVKRCIIDTL